MYIPIILGTAKEGRRSAAVARFLLNQAKGAGIETEIVDVKEYPLSYTGQKMESVVGIQEKIQKADGYVIVSPEYNHGYPGELKLFLDSFYKEYARKPVALCGVSAGGLGGSRMVEQLKLVCHELQLVVIHEVLYVSNAGSFEETVYQERAQKMIGELLWYAGALKSARDLS